MAPPVCEALKYTYIIYIYMYVCMSVWMYVCMYVCVSFYVCMYMCVCIIWTDVKLLIGFSLICRGTWHTIRDHVQRSYLIVWDTEPDQLCVPAVRSFFRNSKGPSLEPQQQCYTICCTVVAIWNQCWSFTISSAASEPSSVFSPNHVADSIFDFLGIFRRNHVADVFGLFCQNYVADI